MSTTDALPVIAIDGPTASGKGTLAKRIAAHYGFAHLDTGALYRAVGFTLLKHGNAPQSESEATEAARSLDLSGISDADLRNDEVGAAASVIAAMPAVRAALLGYQRRFALTPPPPAKGSVLDGRDIGTIVCPDAAVKLFITADAKTRAHRRYLEFKGRGMEADEAQILAGLEARDRRDSEREAAPLKPAPDAHLLDTTKLDIEAAFRAACAIIDQALR